MREFFLDQVTYLSTKPSKRITLTRRENKIQKDYLFNKARYGQTEHTGEREQTAEFAETGRKQIEEKNGERGQLINLGTKQARNIQKQK